LEVRDLGAGTGVVARELQQRGARVSALDIAGDMVAHLQHAGIAAVQGDLLSLPFENRSADGAVFGFSLSHVDHPVSALQEAMRVTRPGGFIAAAVFATGPRDPSKEAVDQAAESFGFAAPAWYVRFKQEVEPLTSRPGLLERCARAAGLVHVRVREAAVDTGIVAPEELVAVRLGMAHVAPFVARLSVGDRAALTRAAVEALGSNPQRLRPAVLLLSSTVPA